MQIDEIVQKVCSHYSVLPTDIAKRAHGASLEITYHELITRIIQGHPNGLATVFPEISRTTITTLLSKVFPGKVGSRILWGTYLLSILKCKQCGMCKSIKCIEEFYTANLADGLRSECKDCHNKDTSSWYKANLDKATEYRKEYYLLNKEDIQRRNAQYYLDNKEAIAERNKEYYLSNKDSISLVHKAYYEKNKLFYKEYKREYYLNNKAKYLAYDAKRRAAKLNSTPSWANDTELYRIYTSRREGEHVDHIIPLQGKNVCGLHCESNLQYLSAKENLEKGSSFDADGYIHQIAYTPPYIRD